MPRSSTSIQSSSPGNAREPKILETLTGSDALSIIRVLVERHEELAQEIDSIAAELLGEIDVEALADDVKMELEALDVEEVWDRSGARTDGYVDPGDMAWQMFEEILEPFCDDIEKCQRLGLIKKVNLWYQGILKGIHDFDKESATEYKEWAEDAPGEFFGQMLKEWKALSEGRIPLAEMQDFIKDHCPGYAEWATRLIRSQ